MLSKHLTGMVSEEIEKIIKKWIKVLRLISHGVLECEVSRLPPYPSPITNHSSLKDSQKITKVEYSKTFSQDTHTKE